MNTDFSAPRAWLERAGIASFVLVYLVVFATVIPSGDGQVYARHYDAGELVFNPNHLLMDPVGYFWCAALSPSGLSTLDALKWLSGVATVITLWIFHAVLLAAGVRSRLIRLAAVLGLFASRNFLTMAISEEFFMLEMPLLAWALWLLVRFDLAPMRHTLLLGLALGLATAVSINNVFLGIALAGWLCFSAPTLRDGLVRATAFGGAAAALCLPVFIGAYAYSGRDGGFLAWMLAYGGENSATGQLYGLVMTAKGVLMSGARLVLNTFTNFVSIGTLGTVLKSVAFGAPLEIRPQTLRWVLGVVMLLAVMAVVVVLAWWTLRRWRSLALARVAVVWLAAYYAFNFFWDDSSDQFWFQMLPVLWLLLALYAIEPAAGGAPRRFAPLLVAVFAPGLLLLNTWAEVAPKALQDVAQYQREHHALLRDGDLEIIPGWDDTRWIALPDDGPRVTQVNLMTAAMKPAGDPEHIATLMDRIQRHLDAGGRVFVVRVFDRDDDPTPWDQLRKLGWPRERLQQELARFKPREAAVIGDVVFRELTP
jgi:hypothetical protein